MKSLITICFTFALIFAFLVIVPDCKGAYVYIDHIPLIYDPTNYNAGVYSDTYVEPSKIYAEVLVYKCKLEWGMAGITLPIANRRVYFNVTWHAAGQWPFSTLEWMDFWPDFGSIHPHPANGKTNQYGDIYWYVIYGNPHILDDPMPIDWWIPIDYPRHSSLVQGGAFVSVGATMLKAPFHFVVMLQGAGDPWDFVWFRDYTGQYSGIGDFTPEFLRALKVPDADMPPALTGLSGSVFNSTRTANERVSFDSMNQSLQEVIDVNEPPSTNTRLAPNDYELLSTDVGWRVLDVPNSQWKSAPNQLVHNFGNPADVNSFKNCLIDNWPFAKVVADNNFVYAHTRMLKSYDANGLVVMKNPIRVFPKGSGKFISDYIYVVQEPNNCGVFQDYTGNVYICILASRGGYCDIVPMTDADWDLNNEDGLNIINFKDFAEFAKHWGLTMDYPELWLFAQQWLN